MTVREQLAAEVARIRAKWARMPPVVGADRFEEITIERLRDWLPTALIVAVRGRMNAAETCGAAAGHLLLLPVYSQTKYGDGGPAYRVVARVAFADRPWDRIKPDAYLTADFDALLAALEPGASPEPPPDRPETWHDRPGLL
jgi:hypothetical protein